MPLTQMEPVAAVHAIDQALTEAIGEHSRETLAVYAAHSALETGWWKHLHGYNFGNLRAGRTWAGPTQVLVGASEVIEGIVVSGPSVEHGFRSYHSSESGALDFVRFVALDTTPDNGKPNRYHLAAAAARAGDAGAYARSLGAAGYYTDDVAKYSQALESIARSERLVEALDVVRPGPDKYSVMSNRELLEAIARKVGA